MNDSADKEKLIEFGKKLKALRVKKNFSQEKFAEMTKLDRTYISGLERGMRNPSFLTILKLAESLNVSFSKLLNWREK